MSLIRISAETAFGIARPGSVVFRKSGISVDGSSLVLSESCVVKTDSDGYAEVEVKAGDYEVQYVTERRCESVRIVVPDDSLEYSLVSLISEGITPAPQPLFNLMGFAVDADGDLVPDAGLIPGGQFTIDADSDLIPA